MNEQTNKQNKQTKNIRKMLFIIGEVISSKSTKFAQQVTFKTVIKHQQSEWISFFGAVCTESFSVTCLRPKNQKNFSSPAYVPLGQEAVIDFP